MPAKLHTRSEGINSTTPDTYVPQSRTVLSGTGQSLNRKDSIVRVVRKTKLKLFKGN